MQWKLEIGVKNKGSIYFHTSGTYSVLHLTLRPQTFNELIHPILVFRQLQTCLAVALHNGNFKILNNYGCWQKIKLNKTILIIIPVVHFSGKTLPDLQTICLFFYVYKLTCFQLLQAQKQPHEYITLNLRML